MKTEIDIDTAKNEVLKIDKILEEKHILIGGLAVQQYYVTRDTRDIDLVCDSSTAKAIVDKIYPSRYYSTRETNDDECRPSFEIIHKRHKNKIVCFGPKIKEREEYKYIDWSKLYQESIPFKYRNISCEKIMVPSMETLAFMKLLSFIDRIDENIEEKGEKDLIDFIELTNNDKFLLNTLIDQIRENEADVYIQDKLKKIQKYNFQLWDNSLLVEFYQILLPIFGVFDIKLNTIKNTFDELYGIDKAISFYQIIASKYDERNTELVLNAHQTVIRSINQKIRETSIVNVLDVGSGTGRLIASQYFDDNNVTWSCIEPSKNMAKQFSTNMKSSRMKYKIHNCSVFDINTEVSKNQYDIIILSLVLSSLPRDPDFDELSKLLKPNGVLIITDFYESCPYYDFEYKGKKIALHTRKIKFIEILNNCLKFGLSLTKMDTIENRKGLENAFIIQMLKI